MNIKIQIFAKGLWKDLDLGNTKEIRYNKVINKIGNIETRELSHTNTFSISSSSQNIDVLGLNRFNPIKIATALNRKYVAKYYIDEKIVQEGFVVINNTNDNQININFIDKSLELIDKWNSTSFLKLLKDTLKDTSISRLADYRTAITEMVDYEMPTDTILNNLSEVGGRGYNLALFPNTLNSIGDKFQKYSDGNRPDSRFNPYQSRPIFNVVALLDLATESFEYTPIYDDSVEWDKIKKLFFVAKDLNKNDDKIGDGIYNRILNIENELGRAQEHFVFLPLATVGFAVMNFDVFTARTPNSVVGWEHPLHYERAIETFPGTDYRGRYTIFNPDIVNAPLGNINFSGDLFLSSPNGGLDSFNTTLTWQPRAVWTNILGTGVISKVLPIIDDVSTLEQFDFSIDKSELVTSLATGSFLGILIQLRVDVSPNVGRTLHIGFGDITIDEQVLSSGVVSFDKYGQYVANVIDLTSAASTESVKKLISGVLQQSGILIDINDKNKTVKFFSYGAYLAKRNLGEYKDWSNYVQKNSVINYNTDYGNTYAKNNEIGLSSHFEGNSYNFLMTNNENINNKFKEKAQHYVSIFKDVTSIKLIQNTVYDSYLEYTNTGLGLVSKADSLFTIPQYRADILSSGLGNINIAKIENVNYAELPKGVLEWYQMVDNSIKVTAQFLLPIQEFVNFRLDTPVFIEQLGGFYIVEEISEYIDSRNLVSIKLIKIIIDAVDLDNIRGDIQISVTFSLQEGVPTFNINTTFEFTGILPAGAIIIYQYTDQDFVSLTGTGSRVMQSITPALNGSVVQNLPHTNVIQYFNVYILDSDGSISNSYAFSVPAYVAPEMVITMWMTNVAPLPNSTGYTVNWTVTHFPLLSMLQYTDNQARDRDINFNGWEVIDGNVHSALTLGTPGNPKIVTSPSSVNRFSSRYTNWDRWHRFTINDPNNGNSQKHAYIYLEANRTHPNGHDFTGLSVPQHPSITNGFLGKISLDSSHPLTAHGSATLTVVDTSAEENSMIFYVNSGNRIYSGVEYEFRLTNPDVVCSPYDFDTNGRYKVKLTTNHDNLSSNWVEFSF